jgi:hypothetical protein
MRERVLMLDLKGAIEAFAAHRWKFFSEDEEAKKIIVDVPRGTDESFVVELEYKTEGEKAEIVDELLGASFIKQSKRVTTEW